MRDSNITNTTNLTASGVECLNNAIIDSVNTITITGNESFSSNTQIFSNLRANGKDNNVMIINFNSSYTDNVTWESYPKTIIECSLDDICIINCLVADSCVGIDLYEYGNCIINGNYSEYTRINSTGSEISIVPGIDIYATASPSTSPTSFPSMSPSLTPSNAPTSAPTNSQCDETVQTADSFLLCQMFVSLSGISRIPEIFYNETYLRDTDYCQIKEFFKCDDKNRITHILLNNSNISTPYQSHDVVDLNSIMFDFLPSEIKYIDLSNNPNFGGYISDWSVLTSLETIIFSNCSLTGSVDFEQLSGVNSETSGNNNHSGAAVLLKLDNNDCDVQALDWEYLARMINLKTIDLSNNEFAGLLIWDI